MSKLKLMRLVASPLYPIAYTLEHATKHPVAIKTALTVLGVAYITYTMINPSQAYATAPVVQVPADAGTMILRVPDKNALFAYWVFVLAPWILALFAYVERVKKGSLAMYLSLLAFAGSIYPFAPIAAYYIGGAL